MVRFSCFHSPIHHEKSKKEVHQAAESMSKTFKDSSEDQELKFPGIPSALNPLLLKVCYDNPSDTSGEKVRSPSSVEHCWKPEEMHPCFSPEANAEVHRMTSLKKSQSLGSELHRERRVSSENETEDDINQGFSCDESPGKNSVETSYTQNGMELFESNEPGMNSFNQFRTDLSGVSFQGSGNTLHVESIFSIGDEKHVEEERHKDFAAQLSNEHVSEPNTPVTTRTMEKSCSLPNVRVLLHTSEEGSPSQAYIRCRSRSFEDLDALHAKRKEALNEVRFHAMEDEGEVNNIWESRRVKSDNHLSDGYDSYNFTSLERDSTLSRRHGDIMDKHGRESWVQNLEGLPNTEFKIKRIEEWVSKIDLGDSSPLQETGESFQSNNNAKKVPYVWASVANGKLDPKTNHGMEAAKNYISSLTAASTSAQLANLGLVVIPFLSAFLSLKVLNLPGNAIVRITAGALPRGLHVLNLAKNNISTIEGLRELGRLRVLDLSYNRILRVGHGLASCSSLKELYLAGNKISEVEGLHRLLKLNVLDLRFNKISTAKCLGQLAANYGSLQSLNLDGNPAQTNVGDEHLKKYLHSLLPHLVYYNKQHIRASSSKEVAERSARSSALTSHSSERGLRTERKLLRKGIHNAAISKGLPSSSHGLRGHSVRSPKRSKDHHGRLPPAGIKGTHHHRHNFLDISSKWLNMRPGAPSMRRSWSEGNLGGFS